MPALSVAMPGAVADALLGHLLRADGDEDVCIATYSLSTGRERTTALLRSVILPRDGERHVHGTASFTGNYVLRAAAEAAQLQRGIALLHSHPQGQDWQGLSTPDWETEADYFRVANKLTGMPLYGLTLAGQDKTWSARLWGDEREPVWASSVRSVSDRLHVSWNGELRTAPMPTRSQERTVSAWGPRAQASIARLRVLVVGVGSVGLDVAQRLAATGVEHLGVMDMDRVEPRNLDRMIGATRSDARRGRLKVNVAARLCRAAATARRFDVKAYAESITSPRGRDIALDYDVIFSCVDRPWPRAVLNAMAYTDLIPVLDGGLSLEQFNDGRMRGGVWRTHALLPGRPCMLCNGQLLATDVRLDQEGKLDDPVYIEGADREPDVGAPNVAALSAGVSASLLHQFVSLAAHPGNRGVPSALKYSIATHVMEYLPRDLDQYCPTESELGAGDSRTDLIRESIPPQSVATSHTLRNRADAAWAKIQNRRLNWRS